VAQTGQPSRYDGEAWQRSLGQVDVEGIVEQRFEWLDRFELFRQQPALTNVEVTDRIDNRRSWTRRNGDVDQSEIVR
jgi:hypothetical protein